MATFIINIPVPSSGDGVAVNVSTLVGEKTVTLSGTFRGQYVLLGSHDGSHFDPILSFDAGGVEGIKQTFSGALQWVRIRSQVMGASGVVVNISGLSIPGDNAFGIFPVLMPGASGPQASSDLGLVNYQGDVNFMAQGGVRGSVVVEGSLDNQEFNPIGAFSAEPASSSLLGAQSFEFSPLATGDRIRYVRLNVKGTILSPFVVTMGGSQTSTGGGGASETLHLAYEAGSSILDQTLNLTDAQGGKVIFDATDTVGFTDMEAMQVLVSGGEGAAFLSSGGMILGPTSIQIGVSGYPATCTDGYSIAIGSPAATIGDFNIAIGYGAFAIGDDAIAIGSGTQTGIDGDNGNIAIGSYAATTDGVNPSNANLAIGFGAQAFASYPTQTSIAVGWTALALGDGSIAIGGTATAVGDSSLVVGQGAISTSDGSVVLGSAYAQGGSLSISIGSGASASGDSMIAIGENAVTGISGDVGSIAIGLNASAGSSTVPNNWGIAIGAGSSILGDSNIAIGLGANVNGTANVVMGDGAHVGDPISTLSYDDNVVIGVGSNSYAQSSVVIGRQCAVGLTTDLVPWQWGVAVGFASTVQADAGLAIGYGATVTGDDGMAFGRSATSGARQVTFSSAAAGGADRFEVVSSSAGNLDLFRFEVAVMFVALDTSMLLLYKDHLGNPVCSQVKVAPGTGYLYVTP